jgi:putative Mg2+ transporter-C (MgtC) family protein
MNLNFLSANWHQWPAPWGNVALVLAACLAGAIVGTERERHEKPAGLRTLVLVCLGSAVFTIASFIFATSTQDTGRVAAQIVTGIGFLGAGVILHGRSSVTGATTAATIWMTAAIGMVAGAGYAWGALGLSVLVRLVLVGLHAYEMHAMGGLKEWSLEVDFDPSAGRTRVRLSHLLSEFNVLGAVTAWRVKEDAVHTLTLRVRLPQRRLRELGFEMVSIPEVLAVRESGQPSDG